MCGGSGGHLAVGEYAHVVAVEDRVDQALGLLKDCLLGRVGGKHRVEREGLLLSNSVAVLVVQLDGELLWRGFGSFEKGCGTYYKSIINCPLVEIKRNLNWCSLNRFGTPQHQTNTI